MKLFRFLLTHFNSFFNNYLFFKFTNKCKKEILRCAPPSSHVCDFCFLGGALTVGGLGVVKWGKKVLCRDSWNCIFCLLLWLKSQNVRGASGHPAFMVLVLIKGMRRGDESKIAFCYPRSLRAFLQTYYKWGDLI